MAKVTELNKNELMPISIGMHKVLLNCGLQLTGQEPYRLVYEMDKSKKLIFTLGGCHYSKYKEDESYHFPVWEPVANMNFAFDLDAIAYLDILNSIGAINYFSLPQFQNIVQSTLNDIRKDGKNSLVFGNGSDAFNGFYEKGEA